MSNLKLLNRKLLIEPEFHCECFSRSAAKNKVDSWKGEFRDGVMIHHANIDIVVEHTLKESHLDIQDVAWLNCVLSGCMI